MPIRILIYFLLLLGFAAFGSSAGSNASAQTIQAQEDFSATSNRWSRQLDSAQQEIEQDNLSRARLAQIRADLSNIHREADALQDSAVEHLDPLNRRLSALGPAPEEGAPPEPSLVAAQREQLLSDISRQESRLKEIELILSRIEDLESRTSAILRDRRIADFLTISPFPLAPSTVEKALPDFAEMIHLIATSPVTWWHTLSEREKQHFLVYRIAAPITFAIAFGWFVRRLLLRWFGREFAVQDPSYTKRLTGAIGEGLANGVVPALILGVFLQRALSEQSLLSGLFKSVTVNFCIAAIFLLLAYALPRAVLAPDQPNWRLLRIPPSNARYLSRLTIVLAVVFAVDAFILELQPALQQFASYKISNEQTALFFFVTNILEAIGVLCLCRATIWKNEGDVAEADAKENSSPNVRQQQFWWAIRISASVLAIATLVASILGYQVLGAQLINNTVASGAVIAGLFLLRGLGREAIGAIIRTELFRSNLGLLHGTRKNLKFWVRAAYDILLIAAGFILISPLWGLPFNDVSGFVLDFLKGIQIGNVTISPGDVLVALAVFFVIVLVTRFIQRMLSEQVLPNTTMDTGVQNSLTAGTGYVGLTIAVALAVSALGLDLSNIAIIAGALSVGIGFGLQNIVNNFVSGLILLIERPIKVGDWVVVGAHEGTVKSIKVRATEIETFQRASIIIPNSELVASAVTNWTHKDSYGRVEVPVGVAYGSDIDKVVGILENCLREHKRILPWPEPVVLFQAFGDSSLNFEARGFIAQVEWRVIVASELRKEINRRFNEAEIEIPFPQRDINFKDLDRLEKALAKGGNVTSQD